MGLLSKAKVKLSVPQGEDSLNSLHGHHQGQARVVTFLNQKGGVGKTTMAYHMAHALKNQGQKVLCLDMDPQANLSWLFGVDTDVTGSAHIFHLLINSVRELKALHTSVLWSDVLEERSGLDVIPSGQELSGFELTVAGVNTPRQLILKKFFEKSGLLGQYDTVIIDAPPTLGLIVVNILCASDGIIVPFRPDDFSRKGLNHLNEVLLDIEDMGVTKVPEVLAHIPNLVDSRRRQEGLDLQKISDQISDLQYVGRGPILEPFYNRASLVRCQSQRKSVYDFQSKDFTPLQEQFNAIVGLIQDWEQRSRV